MYNLWSKWLLVTEYNFFDAWGTFWWMLSDMYFSWIKENPLEFEDIASNFKTFSGKSGDYQVHKVQTLCIVSMYLTKYLHESIYEDKSKWIGKYSVPETPSTYSTEMMSNALTLFKELSNECYPMFVNKYQDRYRGSIFS